MKRITMALMVMSLAAAPASAQKIILEYEGGKFPMRVGYCAADKIPQGAFNPFEIMQFVENAEGTLPAGDLVLWTTASSTGGYDVAVQYSRDGKEWSQVTTKLTRMTVKPEDTVRVRQVKILPPDNAEVIPYRRGQLLVTLIFPAAIRNPADFTGKEKYRSTAMFVADFGERTIAQALARYAKKNMASLPNGNARNNQQIAVTFMIGKDYAVTPTQAAGDEDELTNAIEFGIYRCEDKDLRIGTTFRDQVDLAKTILGKK